jgi:hypothetical protein
LLPTRRDARQAGCGGVEISAFFWLMHYPLECCFFWVRMGFGGVRSRRFPFWTEGLKWAEMTTAKSGVVWGKFLDGGRVFCLRRLVVRVWRWLFLASLVVCLPAALVWILAALAFPCIVIGLLASPLCGAAPTFFATAKKVGKESGLQPPARSEPSRSTRGNGPRRDVPSHHPR